MLLQKNMTRTLVDTNVLLRYLLTDNPEIRKKNAGPPSKRTCFFFVQILSTNISPTPP